MIPARKQVVKYCSSHETFAPSFSVIFIGRKAVVSIKHRPYYVAVGHTDTHYGFLFWIRLGLNFRKCFKEQIKHNQIK